MSLGGRTAVDTQTLHSAFMYVIKICMTQNLLFYSLLLFLFGVLGVRSCFVAQAGLELNQNPPSSVSQVLGLWVYCMCLTKVTILAILMIIKAHLLMWDLLWMDHPMAPELRCDNQGGRSPLLTAFSAACCQG